MRNITNEELSLLIKHSTGQRYMELVREMVDRMDVPRIFYNEVMDNEVHKLVLIQLDMFLDSWEPEDWESFGYACALEGVLDMMFDYSLLWGVASTGAILDKVVKVIPDCFKACI